MIDKNDEPDPIKGKIHNLGAMFDVEINKNDSHLDDQFINMEVKEHKSELNDIMNLLNGSLESK